MPRVTVSPRRREHEPGALHCVFHPHADAKVVWWGFSVCDAAPPEGEPSCHEKARTLFLGTLFDLARGDAGGQH